MDKTILCECNTKGTNSIMDKHFKDRPKIFEIAMPISDGHRRRVTPRKTEEQIRQLVTSLLPRSTNDNDKR